MIKSVCFHHRAITNPIAVNVESPDLAAVLDHVRSKGAITDNGLKSRQGVQFFTFQDPDGNAIAFDKFGNGPAIILVCVAFQTRSDPMMSQLASLLSPHFTVFNYDRRGRGDSGDTAPYEVEREVEDIEALINEAGGSAFVFGMSSCGVLALEVARKLAIVKLALYEPPLVVDNTRPPLPKGYLKQLKESGSSGDCIS